MDGLHLLTAGLPMLPAGQVCFQVPQLLLQTPDQGKQALLLASPAAGEGQQRHQGRGPITGRVAGNTPLPPAQGRFKSRAQRLFPPQRPHLHTHHTHLPSAVVTPLLGGGGHLLNTI